MSIASFSLVIYIYIMYMFSSLPILDLYAFSLIYNCICLDLSLVFIIGEIFQSVHADNSTLHVVKIKFYSLVQLLVNIIF